MEAQQNDYVYVLRNPYMPGLVKIGFTRVDPGKRAAELTSPTGVPAAFEVVAFYSTGRIAASKVEAKLHQSLEIHRINPRRAFFMLSESAAISLVESSLRQCGIDVDTQRGDQEWATIDTTGITSEDLAPTGDRKLGVDDGRQWPASAEKWQWEYVLKLKKPATPADPIFSHSMKSVVGSGLQNPESPEYLLGFYQGVHDRYDHEEQRIAELRELDDWMEQ
jgi:hypothetical protein